MKDETPAVSASGSEASEQSTVPPAAVIEAEPEKEADPMALDNFALSPQVKVLLRKKGIESLFPIQVHYPDSYCILCHRRVCSHALMLHEVLNYVSCQLSDSHKLHKFLSKQAHKFLCHGAQSFHKV